MRWPEPESKKKIPEGHYSFRLNREPELKSFDYTDKNGKQKTGHQIVLYAIGLNSSGEFSVCDKITVWEDRYASLCEALGVEHGKDIEMSGALFEADIIHEVDKKDPTKSWPRIVNIRKAEDDIPF